MPKKVLIFVAVLVMLFALYRGQKAPVNPSRTTDQANLQEEGGGLSENLDPLTIENLRSGQYPGSEITIEQTLDSRGSYDQYIASYRSEGNKIYGLLTMPSGQAPTGGWPAIIFNHGFIQPAQYQTAERYVAYLDAFAGAGYVVFKPDFRGHGNSEGEATGGYGSNAYAIDVLNATSSIKKMKRVNSNKIGMWGHSMGGYITLRNMVTNKDIKAGVIWAGVVASYPDLINRWRRNGPSPVLSPGARRWRQSLIEKYGSPEENPKFWASISANSYLDDISGPLQLHHGTADSSVPVEFSQTLSEQMKKAGKKAELYTYPGDDHNIAANFGTAMQRSVEFFDTYLK